MFGLAALVGCGGTFTHGDDGTTGGSGGSGDSAGTVNHGGDAGTAPNGGDAGYGATAGYGAVAGDLPYGGSGGDAGGWGGDISGGSGGSGGDLGGFGGDAGAAGTSGACGYAPAIPSPVTFVYSTNTPVYIRQTCGEGFLLAGCGATEPLTYEADCVAACNSTQTGCLECGACALTAQLVDTMTPAQAYWGGELFTYGTLPSGCSCASGSPARYGTYTVSVTAYLTPEDAMSGTNGYVHTQTFSYPPPSGTVNVFLGFLAE